jgi:hypothetical protein
MIEWHILCFRNDSFDWSCIVCDEEGWKRKIGGGKYPADVERNQKFEEIRKKLVNDEYPGLAS